MGIDPAKLIPTNLQREQAEDFELWPEHAAAWLVYLGSATQWRRTVGWKRTEWDGLDYAGVEIVMRRYGVAPERENEVFAQLQVLEQETLKVRNSQK